MPKFDPQNFAQTIERIRTKALAEGRLLLNPDDEKLEQLAEKEPDVRRTRYGSLVAESEPTSRAAMFTRNSVDHPSGKAEHELLLQAEEVLRRADVPFGDGNDQPEVRLDDLVLRLHRLV